MISFFRQLVVVLVIAGGCAALVRFVLPTALRVAAYLLTDLVSVLAAAALLLDVVVSSTARRRRAAPPRWVYEYGDAVSGAVRIVRLVLHRTCRGVAVAARTIPPPLVAALAVGIQLIQRLA